MRKRLLISSLVLILTLVAGELLVRVSEVVKGEGPPHLDESIEREWQWVVERRRGEENPRSVVTFHPTLGHITAPSIRRDNVRTNSAGARSDREFELARSPGVPRMVLVGDSYTFGWNVSNEEAWGEVLQREYLPGWEVINLGVPGYGTDQALLLYETIGAEYAPDVVVLGFFVRDFFRNMLRFRGRMKPYFELDAEEMRLVERTLVPLEELYELYDSGERSLGGWGYSHLYTKIQSSMRRGRARRELDENAYATRLLAGILRRFRDQAVANGARPFFLIFPEKLEKHLGTYWETIDRLALAAARELEIPALSLTEVYAAEEAHVPDVPLNPAHLSARGNEVAAEALHAALIEAGYVPAPEAR